jgi:hypothetical protein
MTVENSRDVAVLRELYESLQPLYEHRRNEFLPDIVIDQLMDHIPIRLADLECPIYYGDRKGFISGILEDLARVENILSLN